MSLQNNKTKEITIKIPGDKSISHRAIILASLSDQEIKFKNFLMSDDCINTIKCFQDMGVNINIFPKKTEVLIKGVGLFGLKKPQKPLYVGNSGTSIRLLSGVLVGQNFDTEIYGDQSIAKRPMKRIIEPLRLMGADISGTIKNNDIHPPLNIKSVKKLKAIKYKMPVASAQVDASLRLAGLYCKDKLVIDKSNLSYRNHTEIMLDWFNNIQNFKTKEFIIPSDISSAAFFLVAGLFLDRTKIRLTNINFNKTRNGILEVLQKMGAKITIEMKKQSNFLEKVADITVEKSELKAVVITKELIPTLIDEIPIIALAACFAKGETIIKDASELRFKESDRLKTIAIELNKIGANIKETDDGLIIKEIKNFKDSFNSKSYGDHRIAMMLLIASLINRNTIKIDDTECIKTSFPSFCEIFNLIKKEVDFV